MPPEDWTQSLSDGQRSVATEQGWKGPADAVAAFEKLKADGGKSWDAALTPEQRSFGETRGWKGVSDLANAHDALMKLKGAPAEELFRLPKSGADLATVGQLFDRLGIPKDAAGYKFEGLQISKEHEPLVQSFVEKVAAKHRVAPAHARAVVEWLEAERAESVRKAEEQFQTAGDAAVAALKQKWATAYDGKLQDGRHAADVLGIDDTQLALLEQVMGPQALTEKLAELGEKLREYKVVEGDATKGLTAARAKSRIAEIQADPAFRDPANPRQKELSNEYLRLQQLLVGNAPIDGAPQPAAAQ